MCLGLLYYCSPDEVVFLTTRDAYEPHYVDDRKYFELDTLYGGFAKHWDERPLPMRTSPAKPPSTSTSSGSGSTAASASPAPRPAPEPCA